MTLYLHFMLHAGGWFGKPCADSALAPVCPLLESMLIWLIPVVPGRRATLHLFCWIDVSAWMSHSALRSHSLSAWSDRGPSLNATFYCLHAGTFASCDQGWDVYVNTCCSCSCECCCFRSCVGRTQRIHPVCSVFPPFIYTSALHFLPFGSPW